MFGFKKKDTENRKLRNNADNIIIQVMDSLQAAGYSDCKADYQKLHQYYESHRVWNIESKDLQLSALLMVWLYWKYGEPKDRMEIEAYTWERIIQPQLSLFFYWIPTQYILCRRYGCEIRLRAKNPNNVIGPEPNMSQTELEQRYFKTRDALVEFMSFHNLPAKMTDMFYRFNTNVVKVMQDPPTRREPVAEKVGMQPARQFHVLNEKSMKPASNPEVYGYTDYLDNLISTEDIGKYKGGN